MGIVDYLIDLWRIIGLALWLNPALPRADGCPGGHLLLLFADCTARRSARRWRRGRPLRSPVR